MRLRSLLGLVVTFAVVVGASCGPSIDLAEDLEITDTFTGWYDFGVVDGYNKLVPSISFRLKNNGSVPVDRVQLTVSFWRVGDDGEKDAKLLSGIGAEAVEPGSVSEPILVRGDWGYTLQQARAELFTHSEFRDFVAKVFARKSGEIVPLGEFTLERRIIPQSQTQ